MNKLILRITGLTLVLFFGACKNPQNETKDQTNKQDALISTILTAEERAALSPQKVLEILKQGNDDFTRDNLTIRNNSEKVRQAASGQYPKAIILSCMDSRVPVEDIFHRGIGDIFVTKVAGNIINEDILGSMEYACKVSGAKLIVVLGHESCGAIKEAINDVKLGHITTLLSKIRPVVSETASFYDKDTTAKNPEFVEAVVHNNVLNSIHEIRLQSPILKKMEEQGEIMIVGAIYNLRDGTVDFF